MRKNINHPLKNLQRLWEGCRAPTACGMWFESFPFEFQRPVYLSRLWLYTNTTDYRTSPLGDCPWDISCRMATSDLILSSQPSKPAPPALLMNGRYHHLPGCPCHPSLSLSNYIPLNTSVHYFCFLIINQILTPSPHSLGSGPQGLQPRPHEFQCFHSHPPTAPSP